MAVFWISECLPLAITSLLPLVLLPLAGVLGTKEVSVHYLGATNMMFVAGLMMAVAVEHCGLHHRIALAILSLVGTSPALIMLGFMACSMFLSMWISNTACTAMMVPIVDAISLAISSTNRDEELEEVERAPRSGPKEKEEDRSKSSEVTRNFLLLSVAYASNIGGTGVITGSPPNLVVLNVLDSAYGEGVSPLTYASWMGFCVPLMVVNTVLAWVWIVLLKKMYTRACISRQNQIEHETLSLYAHGFARCLMLIPRIPWLLSIVAIPDYAHRRIIIFIGAILTSSIPWQADIHSGSPHHCSIVHFFVHLIDIVHLPIIDIICAW